MFALKSEHVRFLQDFIVWPKCLETETTKTEKSRDRKGQAEMTRPRRPDRKVLFRPAQVWFWSTCGHFQRKPVAFQRVRCYQSSLWKRVFILKIVPSDSPHAVYSTNTCFPSRIQRILTPYFSFFYIILQYIIFDRHCDFLKQSGYAQCVFKYNVVCLK